MSRAGITKENMRLDITLLKQQQVDTNDRVNAIGQGLGQIQQDFANTANSIAFNVEAIRRLLIKKGIFEEEEYRAAVEEVLSEVKESMQRAEAENMGVAPPGAGAPSPMEDETDAGLYGDDEDDEDEDEAEELPQTPGLPPGHPDQAPEPKDHTKDEFPV
jgi:polyhydroxyalkanoate synthesis regulator phasin